MTPPRFSRFFFSTGTYATNLDALRRKFLRVFAVSLWGMWRYDFTYPLPYTLPRCMLVHFRVSWYHLYSRTSSRTVSSVPLNLSPF